MLGHHIVRRLQRLSLGLLGVGAWVLAHGLAHEPGASQAGVPLAALWVPAWYCVAMLALTSATWPARWDWDHGPMKASSWVGFFAWACVAGIAATRAVAWAWQFGWWSSRSVWAIWVVGFAMACSVIAAGLRVVEQRVRRD